MPQPSRAERRRQARGGAAPPPRRDPMRPIYIGVGIAVAALIAAFLIFNLWQKRTVAAAYATPTPGPNASSKPIQLVDGGNLGTNIESLLRWMLGWACQSAPSGTRRARMQGPPTVEEANQDRREAQGRTEARARREGQGQQAGGRDAKESPEQAIPLPLLKVAEPL